VRFADGSVSTDLPAHKRVEDAAAFEYVSIGSRADAVREMQQAARRSRRGGHGGLGQTHSNAFTMAAVSTPFDVITPMLGSIRMSAL
jgi:hypothetical protein